jgi:hypothetical protein
VSQASQFPILVDGVRYVWAPDDAVSQGSRTSAIVQARLIDELTANPLVGPITIRPAGTAFQNPRARNAVNPRAADGGVVGLVGTAIHALPALRTTAYEVGVTARAPGYIATTRTRMLGPDGSFPGVFVPAALGDVAMHREPVILYGRANVRTATAFNPLPNATVRVSGIWRSAPTLILSPPAAPANISAVDPVMYAPRPAGASMRAVTLTPDIANEKRLLCPASAGATEVFLSNRAVLAANGVLGLDETDPSRAEWIVVQGMAGAVNATEPAVVTLAFPLARSHAAGAVARPVAVSAPSGAQPLAIDAIAGDTTLLLGGLGGITSAAVEIVGGIATPEYHRLALYETVTDVDGQWQLPPLSRVAQLTLTATHATFTSPPRTVTVGYPQPEQRLDLAFS